MMTRSIDQLRRDAKRLKRAFEAADPEARVRVGACFPDAAALKHVQALHVIAREQGAASWPRLKLAHELTRMDRGARAGRLRQALFHGRDWVVEDLLAADPTLPRRSLGLLCALYDSDGVAEALAQDPGAATRPVDGRAPLLHLAFSRRWRAAPERADAMIAIAEALVAAGADVNDGFPPEPGSEHRLSALYGALGHAGNLRLAEWLLARGATPDDDESLYHATELDHLDGVRLLLRWNARISGTNALPRMLDFDNLEGARLLLDHGADPNEAVRDHPSGQPIDTVPALHQAARRRRDGRFAELLLARGADPSALWRGHSAYATARIYGNQSFADALEAADAAPPLSPLETALAACAEGAPPPGRPLDEGAGAALTEEARLILTRVILWPDRLAHAQALVAAGIDPNAADEMALTPLHAAGWAGLPAQTAWLLTLGPDFGHVNGYGGDLMGTIVHGAENAPDSPGRDPIACARLALEAGAPLTRSALRGAGDEEMSGLLAEWADAHPDRIVEDASA